MQATGGRWTVAGMMTGLPLVMLTTTGAKSGQARTVPLVAMPDGERVVLIASNWGGEHLPAWYHNLSAHRQATIGDGGRKQNYQARELKGKEYDVYWRRVVCSYRGYEAYKERTNGRPIPLMMLELLKVSG